MASPDSFTAAEPVVTGGGITAAIVAVVGSGIAVAQAFGTNLNAQQVAAILGAVGTVTPLAVALRARRFVTPTQPAADPAPTV